MKFRQAKKIVHGNSSVHKKYRKRRPPHEEVVTNGIHSVSAMVWPSLHDIDIIRRAMRVFLHHYKKHKKKDLS